MNNENISKLLLNINKLHTTKLGMLRIIKNLKIKDKDVIEYLKNEMLNKDALIYKKGKNYYCKIGNITITINSYNYCVITAHLEKK